MDVLRPLVMLAAVCFSAAISFAQPDAGFWRGELHSDSLHLFNGFTVELTDLHHNRVAWTDVRSDGEFTLPHVGEGEYQLTVLRGQQTVQQSFFRVPCNPGDLEVRLPEEKVDRPPSGPVSVTQLMHPPQRKALQHFAAAQKFSEAGEYAKAAAELEKSIQISPEFADAHTNLGAQYLRLGRTAEAVPELQRGVGIQPSALGFSNLAYGQLMMRQSADAMKSAREALRLDPTFPAAHYVLGMALSMTGGSLQEAAAHLEKAAEKMPGAQTNLERIRAQIQAQPQ